MKMFTATALACMSLGFASVASADELGRHPHYIHALSDLRAAQWQVDHRRAEGGEIQEDELVSSDEVAAAIQSTRRAAAQDGKDLDYSPPPDIDPSYEGRLHAAMDLLRKARADLALPEDDPRARAQQRLSILHVDAALHAADRAIHAVHRFNDARE